MSNNYNREDSIESILSEEKIYKILEKLIVDQAFTPEFLSTCIVYYTENDNVCDKYNELLMAVERKHLDETRHQTALRYIIETEKRACSGSGSVKCQQEVVRIKEEV